MLFRSFLFLASCFHFPTWSWWRSCSTTSIHLVFGRFLGLLPVIPPIITCFVSLFWKSLYMSQPAQSLCLYYRRYWGFAVHLHQFIVGPPLPLIPFLLSTVYLPEYFFPKYPAFLSLFGSFSKVHCHRGLLVLLSLYKYLVLSSSICFWFLVSTPKPSYMLCPLLFFVKSLFLPCRYLSVLHPWQEIYIFETEEVQLFYQEKYVYFVFIGNSWRMLKCMYLPKYLLPWQIKHVNN